MTNANTNKRRDPLNEVVDIDSQRIGAEFHLNKIPFWAPGDVPRRPLGVVPFEVSRQFATFLVPAALLVTVGAVAGSFAALIAAPVAIAVGALFDWHLMRAIRIARGKEVDIDKGRYALTRELCARLNLTPEEINCTRVSKLCQDFLVTRRTLLAQWHARQNAGKNSVSPSRGRSYNPVVAGAGVAAAMGTAAYASGSDNTIQNMFDASPDEPYDWNQHDDMSHIGDVNPANGMPMIDSTFDVSGNVFGSDTFH